MAILISLMRRSRREARSALRDTLALQSRYGDWVCLAALLESSYFPLRWLPEVRLVMPT
jgi:hypothetical protein